MPPGVHGTIIDVKVFSRKGIDKDSRTLAIEGEEIALIEKDYKDEIDIVKNETAKKIRGVLVGKKASKSTAVGKVSFKKGEAIQEEEIVKLSIKDLVKVSAQGVDQKALLEMESSSKDQVAILKSMLEEKVSRLKKGDDLAPGVIKMVKVFMAMKRKLQVLSLIHI